MKKIVQNFLPVLVFSIFLFGCKKGDIDLKSTEIGIDPAVNIDMVNQLLQLEGTLVDGDLPASKKGFTGQIYPIRLRDGTLKADSIFYGYDDSLFVTFKILSMPGVYKIRSLQFKLQGAKAYWKVPVINDNSGEYAFTFSIPRLIKQSDLRLDFNAEVFASQGTRRDSAVTDSATVYLKVPKPLPCNGPEIIGNNGLFQRQVKLGNVPGKVKLLFLTGGVGDRLDVRYNGQYIISTCPSLLSPWQFPKCNSPAECFVRTREGDVDLYKEYSFEYDPAKSKTMDIMVTGYCTDLFTYWKLKIQCP
jgi:hypothetical protein